MAGASRISQNPTKNSLASIQMSIEESPLSQSRNRQRATFSSRSSRLHVDRRRRIFSGLGFDLQR